MKRNVLLLELQIVASLDTVANSMQSIWVRIKRWLRVNAPSVLETLQVGASDAEIAELEARLSIQLPEDVKASYRIHNGQRDDCESRPFLYSYEMLSLQSIHRQWEIEQYVDRQIREIQGDDYSRLLHLELEETAVRHESWNANWIPLATDISGDHYCLDLAPAKTGTVGQMIGVEHESDIRPLLAPSFRVWLERFADALETGEYVFSEKYKGILSAKEVAEYERGEEF